jgi:hypothetical protein
MADVKVIPKIQCDNCGAVEDKVEVPRFVPSKDPTEYAKPRNWGACRIEGRDARDIYGEKEHLAMPDLCPRCAKAVLNEAANALANIRRENTDGT